MAVSATKQKLFGMFTPVNLAAVAVVLAGLLIRAYHADYNLDTDEVFSVRLASSSFGQVILQSLADRPHPPLYNILLHCWLLVWGTSEAAARSLSIAFSAGFLLAAHALLRRSVCPWTAVGALALLAISPFFVYYGAQARPYSLIGLLSAVNLLAYFRLLQGTSRLRLVSWALTCVLLLYAQYLAILVVGLEIMLAWFRTGPARGRIVTAGAIATLSIVPWAAAAMGRAALAGSDPLSQISWITSPSFTELIWFYARVFGSAANHVRLLAGLLGLLGLWYAISIFKRRSPPAFEQAFAILLAFGLPGVCFLISIWGRKPIFADRQLSIAALCAVLFFATAVDALPRSARILVTALLALSVASSLPGAFPENAKPPWRRIAAELDARYGVTGIYTREAWIADPLRYYRKRGGVLLLPRNGSFTGLGHALVMCRVYFCADFQPGSPAAASSEVNVWSWGPAGEPPTAFTVLRLYELPAL
jgi:mannosyltransferase